MPTYSYACTACAHEFDAQQSFSDSSLTECPQCAGRLRKKFGAVGVVFKGSGFYRTDSRNAAKASADGGAGSSNGKSEGGKSESGKSESGKSEGGKSESGKSESGKSEGGSSSSGSGSNGSSGSSSSSGSGTSGSGASSKPSAVPAGSKASS